MLFFKSQLSQSSVFGIMICFIVLNMYVGGIMYLLRSDVACITRVGVLNKLYGTEQDVNQLVVIYRGKLKDKNF